MTSLEAIAGDREHGAAWLSLRALELLRSRAAELAAAGGEEAWRRRALCALARGLRSAQPTMAVLQVRVDRLMHGWLAGSAPTAAGLAALAAALLREHARAEEQAAALAAAVVAGHRVLTLSRSATVHAALIAAEPPPAVVLVARSLPGGEGEAAASDLRAAGIDAHVIPDDEVPMACGRDVELLLAGADAVLADGVVVNKVGTQAAARAAHASSRPCYAVAAADKVAPEGFTAPASVLFETSPALLWTAVLSERGPLAGAAIAALAREHPRWADWLAAAG